MLNNRDYIGPDPIAWIERLIDVNASSSFAPKAKAYIAEALADIVPNLRLLDPIQNNCVHGYVLPDRCRYTRHLGCDCGAYPPIPKEVK